MYVFKRTNKTSGVHWLKTPIEGVKIKVTLKPTVGICLPKFEEYTTNAQSVNEETFNTNEEHSVGWQKKVFSLWEMQQYSDVHNCTSDMELTYHNMLNDSEYNPSKVFTYIHEDYYLPLPLNDVMLPNNSVDISESFEILSLKSKTGRAFGTNSSSISHLLRSESNLEMEDKWTAMHVVFDNSEYNGDSQLVFKEEAILVSLYHHKKNNYLLISPYGNDLDMNPYRLETKAGVPLGYEYAVDIQFEDGDSTGELLTLLKELDNKWETKHKPLLKFAKPPLGKHQYYVALDILHAKDFEAENMYLEYNIKLPEGIKCADSLQGRTHVTKPETFGEWEQWNYTHLVELAVEIGEGTGIAKWSHIRRFYELDNSNPNFVYAPSMTKDHLDPNSKQKMRVKLAAQVLSHSVAGGMYTKISDDPLPLQIFLEAISTDWWGRHRTEGYCRLALSLYPGCYSKMLYCSRPEEEDKVEAESRRFFVGGCHLIKDLDVLADPQLQDGNVVFTTTGSIQLRWSVVSHSPKPGHQDTKEVAPSTSASSLLQGAEAALKQYSKAKARLAAATKDLDDEDGSGDG